MLKFRENLYLPEGEWDLKKVKHNLKTGRGQLNIYVIAISSGDNQLEYFHNSMFKQKILHRMDYSIVGLARSTEECNDLIVDISKDCFEKRGDYDMKAFLMNNKES